MLQSVRNNTYKYRIVIFREVEKLSVRVAFRCTPICDFVMECDLCTCIDFDWLSPSECMGQQQQQHWCGAGAVVEVDTRTGLACYHSILVRATLVRGVSVRAAMLRRICKRVLRVIYAYNRCLAGG